MQIFLFTQDSRYIDQHLGKISDWNYLIVGVRSDVEESIVLKHDFWIGASRDGRYWVLAASPYVADSSEKYGPEQSLSYVPLAALIDPPERRSTEIGEILLRVYFASLKRPLSVAELHEIASSVEFNPYKAVGDFAPWAPREWLDLPAELRVDVEISEHSAINSDFLRDYAFENLSDALSILAAPRHPGLLFRYDLEAVGIIPFAIWQVASTLSRRDGSKPFRRLSVQNSVPWERQPNRRLISLYQSAPMVGSLGSAPSYFAKHTVVLAVAGASETRAESNWKKCAIEIRKIARKLREPRLCQ